MIYPIRKYLNIAEQKADFFFFFFWWIKPNGEHFYCFHCSSNPIDLAKWIFHIPFCRQHLFKLMVAASSVVLLAYKLSSFTRSYHCYCRCWFFWTRTIIPLVVVDIQFHFHWNHWSNFSSMHNRKYELKETKNKNHSKYRFFLALWSHKCDDNYIVKCIHMSKN